MIAGLGNVVWCSYLHSGGAGEVEDTNRRFRSLQPSPEKEQKVSTFVSPVCFSRIRVTDFPSKGQWNLTDLVHVVTCVSTV